MHVGYYASPALPSNCHQPSAGAPGETEKKTETETEKKKPVETVSARTGHDGVQAAKITLHIPCDTIFVL